MTRYNDGPSLKGIVFTVLTVVALAIAALLGVSSWETAEPGTVKVPVLFGELQRKELRGPEFTNPFYEWREYDLKMQTEVMEDISIFTQDQLPVVGDITVQWQLNPESVFDVAMTIGTMRDLDTKIVLPAIRGAVRDAGKMLKSNSDLFTPEGEAVFSKTFREQLEESVSKHITILAVITRDMVPPQEVQNAIVAKIKAAQEVEQQKAILDKKDLESQERIRISKSEREASENTAAAKKILADAEAYSITEVGKALAATPGVVQLRYLERWDGKLPTMMLGDGGNMMIQLPVK